MKVKVFVLAILFTVFGISGASAATIELFEWIFNVNGTVSDSYNGDPFPPSLLQSTLGPKDGLGTLIFRFTNPGSYNFIAFFDHEIDQSINGFSNEFGAAVNLGSKPGNLLYETGEPGFVTPPPNIYTRTLAGALGNIIGAGPDDVAMALGWNFNLASGETALITLNLSPIAPAGGFYLRQTDPDSPADIYYSSALNIQGGVGPTIPEPATMLLLGSGLVGLAGLGRKKLFKK